MLPYTLDNTASKIIPIESSSAFTFCARNIRPCILCYNIRLCIRHSSLLDGDSHNKDMDLHNRKHNNQLEEPPKPLQPVRVLLCLCRCEQPRIEDLYQDTERLLLQP